MSSNQTISTVLKTLKAAYPRFMIDEADTVRVWASFLADIDDDLLLAAVTRFISSSSHAFAPSIPEIRNEATAIRREIADIPSAFEAWDELISAPTPRPTGAAYQIWRDGKPVEQDDYVFPHEIVGMVARRLGYPDRFPSVDTEMADRAHFIKAYEAEVNKILKSETQLPMVSAYIENQREQLGLIDVSRDMRQLTAGLARRKA